MEMGVDKRHDWYHSTTNRRQRTNGAKMRNTTDWDFVFLGIMGTMSSAHIIVPDHNRLAVNRAGAVVKGKLFKSIRIC